MSESAGIVYLLGSGPGDPCLLTWNSLTILQRAEVLVYDALVNEQILNLISPNCECIYAGKRGGKVSTAQTSINQVLVDQCLRGKVVVRLKSGDPFIFGRCRAELDALTQAGCRVVVVPGLSSAIAGPTLAGIPLTDPEYSNCFAVVSGHHPDALDWSALSRLDTLVILMGTQTLPHLVQALQTYGKPASTPIAVLKWVGHPMAQSWIATLADITAKTAEIDLSPAIIVVGEVVTLRNNWGTLGEAMLIRNPALPDPSTHLSLSSSSLQVAMARPLTGKTILVTRAAGQSSRFTHNLTALGACVLELPALEIQPPSSWHDLDTAIHALDRYDWLILTSANAVNYFCDRIHTLGLDARALAGVKIAVVGEKTAQVLAQRSLKPDFIPPDFVADALVAHFPESVGGQSFLFPRVETGGRDVLVKTLTAQGGNVTEVAAYQSDCPAEPDPTAFAALENKQVNIVTFASSKTVHCFCKLVGQKLKPLLTDVLIASIGPQTSQACLAALGRVDIEATEYTLEGLTQAIVQAV